jgi:hypothetical protein
LDTMYHGGLMMVDCALLIGCVVHYRVHDCIRITLVECMRPIDVSRSDCMHVRLICLMYCLRVVVKGVSLCSKHDLH